jgi:hypothetical protein
MIIACPSCGFPGRIPSYAFASPYNARCPKCQYRFELGPRTASLTGKPGPDPFRSSEADDLELLRGGDPSSSSYELKAMGGEDAEALQPEESIDAWDDADDLDGAYARQDSSHRALPPPTGRLAGPAATSTPWSAESAELRLPEPWHARVLEGWGVLLLAWAALIVVQSLRRAGLAGVGVTSGSEVVMAVIAVLLLTAGAGGLFWLVELGRHLRAGGADSSLPGRLFGHRRGFLASLRARRLWRSPLAALHSARS